MRRRSNIFQLFYTLIAAVIVAQCGVSLALAVHEGWHEAVHHHEGEDDHDCPVVALAHGFWDAPLTPVFDLPRPPAPPVALTFPDTARPAPALILSASVLEHAPPGRGSRASSSQAELVWTASRVRPAIAEHWAADERQRCSLRTPKVFRQPAQGWGDEGAPTLGSPVPRRQP